jgi:hypothetical protein
VIALAVGIKAMVYDQAGGVRCSEEDMKVYFGDDLGFKRKLTTLTMQPLLIADTTKNAGII